VLVLLPAHTGVSVHDQAEAELEALRSELQQQQQELSKRAEALAAAAKQGAAQVRPTTPGWLWLGVRIPTAAFCTEHSKSNTHQCEVCQLAQEVPESCLVDCLLLQAAWIESEKDAAKRAEAWAADLAAKEARLAAKEEALAAQQQVWQQAVYVCWQRLRQPAPADWGAWVPGSAKCEDLPWKDSGLPYLLSLSWFLCHFCRPCLRSLPVCQCSRSS
jgi:hypothetical protein